MNKTKIIWVKREYSLDNNSNKDNINKENLISLINLIN
jgi:hypothetical protein